MRTQKTFIYQLVMRNQKFDTFLLIFIFWPLLVVKWAWPPTAPLWVLGLKTQQKLANLEDFLGQPLSQKSVFENFWPAPPLISLTDNSTFFKSYVFRITYISTGPFKKLSWFDPPGSSDTSLIPPTTGQHLCGHDKTQTRIQRHSTSSKHNSLIKAHPIRSVFRT